MVYSFKYESKDNKAFIFMLFLVMFFNIYFYLFIWHCIYDNNLKCIFKNIFYFIFDCAGSSLLHTGFL